MEAAKTPEEKQPRAARTNQKTTGGTRVRTEADKALRQKGHTIVDALAKSAEKGNVQCFKVLYELTRENEARGGSGAGGAIARSRAAKWMAEQEWIAPKNDALNQQSQQTDI